MIGLQDVAHSLKELLEYDGDVEEDLCVTFQASIGQNGKMVTEDLMKGDVFVLTLELRTLWFCVRKICPLLCPMLMGTKS